MIVPFGGRVDSMAQEGLARFHVCACLGKSRRGGMSPGVYRISGVGESCGGQHFAEVQQASRCGARLSVHLRMKREKVVAGLFYRLDDIADRLDDRYRDGDVVTLCLLWANAQNVAVDLVPRR